MLKVIYVLILPLLLPVMAHSQFSSRGPALVLQVGIGHNSINVHSSADADKIALRGQGSSYSSSIGISIPITPRLAVEGTIGLENNNYNIQYYREMTIYMVRMKSVHYSVKMKYFIPVPGRPFMKLVASAGVSGHPGFKQTNMNSGDINTMSVSGTGDAALFGSLGAGIHFDLINSNAFEMGLRYRRGMSEIIEGKIYKNDDTYYFTSRGNYLEFEVSYLLRLPKKKKQQPNVCYWLGA